MIICPSQAFDIPAIMNIERQSFIPAIQEKKRVFEKRLKAFPEGFLVLTDSSEKAVKENGFAKVCGYFCSELWSIIPDCDDRKFMERRFSLGHNAFHTHDSNGSFLYVSSFALLKEYRGCGNGEKFFVSSVAALCGARKSIKKVILLVNSEWTPAMKIYSRHGFEKFCTLEKFFPTLKKKEFSDGIVMICDAEGFRSIEFSESKNEFGGIKI